MIQPADLLGCRYSYGRTKVTPVLPEITSEELLALKDPVKFDFSIG